MNLNTFFLKKITYKKSITLLILRDECFCADSFGSYGTAESRGRRCDMTCIKNRRRTCGGDHANAVYCTGASMILIFKFILIYSILD